MDPLNIVVICLDTFRGDIVGPGHKLSHVKTPNLDQLAAEAIRFTRCFGEAQPTLQVRNGCFTGMRFSPASWVTTAGTKSPMNIPPWQKSSFDTAIVRG